MLWYNSKFGGAKSRSSFYRKLMIIKSINITMSIEFKSSNIDMILNYIDEKKDNPNIEFYFSEIKDIFNEGDQVFTEQIEVVLSQMLQSADDEKKQIEDACQRISNQIIDVKVMIDNLGKRSSVQR